MDNLVNGGYVYVALTDAVSAENPNGADPIIAVEGSTEEPEDKPSEDPDTGDFGLIALAFVAISSVVVKKRKEN